MKCEFRWTSINPRPMSTCNGEESRRRLASSALMAEPYADLGWPLLGWSVPNTEQRAGEFSVPMQMGIGLQGRATGALFQRGLDSPFSFNQFGVRSCAENHGAVRSSHHIGKADSAQSAFRTGRNVAIRPRTGVRRRYSIVGQ